MAQQKKFVAKVFQALSQYYLQNYRAANFYVKQVLSFRSGIWVKFSAQIVVEQYDPQ